MNIIQPGTAPSSVPLQAVPVLERAGRGAVGDDGGEVARARAATSISDVGAGRETERADPAGSTSSRRWRKSSAPAMSLAQSQP